LIFTSGLMLIQEMKYIEKRYIIKEARSLADRLLIDPMVGILLVAEMKGVKTREYHNIVEKVLLEGK
jgi:hypothetical protein